MSRFSIVQERVPLVWILVGLLFNAAGLYLGFEFGLTFVYMIVGWFCCAFGMALLIFRLREQPRTTAQTRLSPNFISAGKTQVFPTAAAANSDSADISEPPAPAPDHPVGEAPA